MLRRAEPSEAYPTTLLMSFEGYPPLAFIHGLKARGFLRRRVKKVRVEKDKVLGVTLKDGTQINAASIISNADYKTTFIKLMTPQEVPEEWYHAVFNAGQTGPILQVCLGVK